MNARSLLVIAASVGSLAVTANAQDPRSYSYHSSAKTQSADEVEDLGEISASDSAGREVDGKSMPEPAPLKRNFRFNVSARGDYTSNAKLSGNHASSDLIGLPTLEAGYNVALGQHFTFDLAGKVEAAIFSDHSDRGFVGYSANATLDYRPRPGLPRIYISAEPYRYDNFDIGDSITQAIGFAAGTDYGYAFNNGRSLVYGGYNFARYLSDPSIDDRNSHRVVIGLAHQFRSNLTGQIFYAWQYNDFVEVSRHDSRHLVGASLIYTISERWLGTFSTSFADNDSNAERASYQSVNASFGVTLQF